MLNQQVFQWTRADERSVGTVGREQVVYQCQRVRGVASHALMYFVESRRIGLGQQTILAAPA